jgi:hypothetical protein
MELISKEISDEEKRTKGTNKEKIFIKTNI